MSLAPLRLCVRLFDFFTASLGHEGARHSRPAPSRARRTVPRRPAARQGGDPLSKLLRTPSWVPRHYPASVIGDFGRKDEAQCGLPSAGKTGTFTWAACGALPLYSTYPPFQLKTSHWLLSDSRSQSHLLCFNAQRCRFQSLRCRVDREQTWLFGALKNHLG